MSVLYLISCLSHLPTQTFRFFTSIRQLLLVLSFGPEIVPKFRLVPDVVGRENDLL